MTTIADGPDTFGAPPARAAPRAGVDAQSDFEQLYAARFHGLTLQLYAYLGDLAEAQDVVQEAFCRAFARWSKISQYHDPVAWIRRVAWNLATSRFRRQRATLNFVRRRRPDSVPGPSPDHVALVRAHESKRTSGRGI
jgi:RNA polymerase sigma-70 factor (ECF subfamily)